MKTPQEDGFRERLLADPAARRRLADLARRMEEARCTCVLVGGAVRDALIGRPVTDFDFAVPPRGIEIVRAWAHALDGRDVVLREEPRTHRVVFRDGMIADFAPFRAPTLDEDLHLRDFTINAIALDLRSLFRDGPLRFLDPCEGMSDLREGRIRWTSPRSLPNDPLRMLRAFRLKATLGFRIAEATRARIVENVRLLRGSAWERIREEFFRLLAASRSYPALRAMDDVRLLSVFLPEIEPLRGAAHNEFHHLDVWEHTLAAIDGFERAPVPPVLADSADRIEAYLAADVGQAIPYRALLKFALLFHDVAKPATRTVTPSGRVRFIGHEALGAKIALDAATRLTLGRRARRTVERLVAEHLQTMHLSSSETVPTPRALRRFIRRAGEDWLGVLLLAWADLEAAKGPARTRVQRERTAALIRRIVEREEADRQLDESQPRLLTGHDLIALFGMTPGPQIGFLLREVEEARLSGAIASQEEALSLVQERLGRPPKRARDLHDGRAGS